MAAVLVTAIFGGVSLPLPASPMEARETEQAHIQLEQLRVQQLLAQDNTPRALALLAKMLRLNPSNHLAADRLMSVLSQRSFLLPTDKKLEQKKPLSCIHYTPEGRFIMTHGTNDAKFDIWSATSGKRIKLPAISAKGTLVRYGLGPAASISVYAAATTNSDDTEFNILRGDLYVVSTALAETAEFPGTPGQERKVSTTTIHLTASQNKLMDWNEQELITVSSDNVVWIWDNQSGKLLAKSPPGGAAIGDAIVLAGNRVLLVTADGAKFWDRKKNVVEEEALEYSDEITPLTLSPDGKWLLGWDSDTDRIVLWDATTGKVNGQIRDWSLHLSAVPFFSADGRYLVATGTSGTVRVWDPATCAPITPCLDHFDATFKVEAQAALSSDNRWLATVVPDPFYDKTVRIWDVSTGKLLNSPVAESTSEVLFAPGGEELVTLSADRPPKFWRMRSGDRGWLPRIFEEALCAPQSLRNENRILGLLGTEGTVPALVELRSGTVLARPALRLTNIVGAAVCPQGHCFLTIHDDGMVRTWDAASGSLLRTLSGAKLPSHVLACYSPNHEYIMAWGRHWTAPGEDTKSVLVWNLSSEKAGPIALKNSSGVYEPTFSEDGSRVATACYDGKVRIWDSRSGKLAAPILKHKTRVTSVQFSPDGQRLLTTSIGQAHAWNLKTGKELFPPREHEFHYVEPHMDEFLKMFASFSPDGRRMATASGFTVGIWDAETGVALLEPLEHPAWVEDVKFSPDGARLVTTCADHCVRVWDAASGQLLSEPMRHNTDLIFTFAAQFSRDGDWLVAMTPAQQGLYRLWVWEVPVAPLPVPPWILEFAEALGGQRLDETGLLHAVPWPRLSELQQQGVASAAADFYHRWLRWFVDDKPTRKISPRANLTVLEYAQDRIQENTVESLREAIRLLPTNGPAFARLAKQLLPQNDQDKQRHLGEADFLSRHAVELAPHDAAVAKIRAEVESQIKNFPKP